MRDESSSSPSSLSTHHHCFCTVYFDWRQHTIGLRRRRQSSSKRAAKIFHSSSRALATVAFLLPSLCHHHFNARQTAITIYSRTFTTTTSINNISTRYYKMSTSSTTTILLHNEEKIRHAPKSLLPEWLKAERTRTLTPDTITFKEQKSIVAAAGSAESGSVVYWMQRDMRTVDNWALSWAAHLACSRKLALHVVYALPPPPSPSNDNNNQQQEEEEEERHPPTLIQMPMTARHGHFLLGGLQHVHQELQKENIPMHIVMAESHDLVGQCVVDKILLLNAQILISDFSPLRQFRQWMELQATPSLLIKKNKANNNIPFYQVDTHNIVPVWIAADKQQVGARTLRPRIHRVLKDYLQDFPSSLSSVMDSNNNNMVQKTTLLPKFERDVYETYLKMDESVPPPVDGWAVPGTQAALNQFESFVQNGLKDYHTKRNDPVEEHICSNMSPWLNHGHISFARLAMNVQKINKYASGIASFLEEGIIRRELSDNYLYYCPNTYDSLDGAADWARTSLQLHVNDTREYIYTLQELEHACTHDDLWNAAQLQVVTCGMMHGFLRMYWAKKILEWTTSPLFALRAAQYLNDKYAIDGKDPNGFVGVAWSIMGIHDQGWQERPVFGKIRYMNYNGCKRKFNVAAFVAMYNNNNNSTTTTTKKVAAMKKTADAATKSNTSISRSGGKRQTSITSFSTKKQRK